MARASKLNLETSFVLVEWLESGGTWNYSNSSRAVTYFDDEDEANAAYDKASIPSKLFRVWKECK